MAAAASGSPRPQNIGEETGECPGTLSITINRERYKKIAKEDIDVKPGQNISGSSSSTLTNKIKRALCHCSVGKTIIYKDAVEAKVDIKDPKGSIQLITPDGIRRVIGSIHHGAYAERLAYIHIGTVQILFKSAFQEGINSPLIAIVFDHRLTDPNNAILGIMEGNLAYSKLKFQVSPNFGFSRTTPTLASSLTLAYKFKRENLMRKGDKIFSLIYRVTFALSDSHHAIYYKDNPRISLPVIFKDIEKVYLNKKQAVDELSRKLGSKLISEDEFRKEEANISTEIQELSSFRPKDTQASNSTSRTSRWHYSC